MKINTLVNDEFKKYQLNESSIFSDENLKFKTKISHAIINGLPLDRENTEIFLEWEVQFWVNNNGIENMNVAPKQISGNFIVDGIKKQIVPDEWNIKITNASIQNNGTLYPESIDLKTDMKYAIINF